MCVTSISIELHSSLMLSFLLIVCVLCGRIVCVLCGRVTGASLADNSGKTGVMSDISIIIHLYLMCVSPDSPLAVSVSNSTGASLADNSGKTGVMCKTRTRHDVWQSHSSNLMCVTSISIELMCVTSISIELHSSCLAFC